MGTSNDQPVLIDVSSGAVASDVTGQLGAFVDQPLELDPSANRSLTANDQVWSAEGRSDYMKGAGAAAQTPYWARISVTLPRAQVPKLWVDSSACGSNPLLMMTGWSNLRPLRQHRGS